jgi:hypothetical protein
MALLMVPGSHISPREIVDSLGKCGHIQDWMAKIFYVGKPDTDLAIVERWHAPPGKLVPGWFGDWFRYARTAYTSDEWRIASAEVVILSGSQSVLRPDTKDAWPGEIVTRNEPQPGGQTQKVTEFQPLPTVRTDGEQTLGLTSMSAKVGRDLDYAQKKRGRRADARLMTGSDTTVSALPEGQGVILIGNRAVNSEGKEVANSGSLVPFTLFHELWHAGRISAGEPFKDGDPRFDKIAKQIEITFTGPAPKAGSEQPHRRHK